MTKKAIGLEEFRQLLQEQQFDLLHKDGVYIGKRKPGKQTIVLFQLYSFYVEVHYRKYRKEIDHLVTSDDTAILQPYLEQIPIRDLDKNDGKN
jgi:hypothetical protein